MPRGVGEDTGAQKRRFVDGPGIMAAMAVVLAVIILIVVARPDLLAHNVLTKVLGAPPASSPTPTTTATTALPAPTTTTTTDPATTTTTMATTMATTDPATTTTSTATSTATWDPVTTTVVPYTAPTIKTTVEPGSFGPAAEIASATYPFTTSGGVVSVTGSWSGTTDLTLSVKCGTASSKSSTGPSGLSVSATCPAGSVTVGAAETTTVTVSYSLTVRYPNGGGS